MSSTRTCRTLRKSATTDVGLRSRQSSTHPSTNDPTRGEADMADFTPTREDKFSFGLWTVGWQARDLFGEATRPVLAAVEAVHKLAELGAYGLTFPDDDPLPPGSSRNQPARVIHAVRARPTETGPRVPQVPANPVRP